jgi:hypothetical protein
MNLSPSSQILKQKRGSQPFGHFKWPGAGPNELIGGSGLRRATQSEFLAKTFSRVLFHCPTFLPLQAHFTIKGTQFLGFSYMAAIFRILDSESAPTEIPRGLKNNLEKKKSHKKNTPKTGHEHCLLCGPADVKKKSRG